MNFFNLNLINRLKLTASKSRKLKSEKIIPMDLGTYLLVGYPISLIISQVRLDFLLEIWTYEVIPMTDDMGKMMGKKIPKPNFSFYFFF